ncbi:MAG: glutamate racemase [Oscillospiraceae bacterium]|nr:glutamate racemase [Oscillospiraceae bacterium]
MDNRPIGVFDSGLGGLTAVRELHRLMPEESIVYFGDTARVPYGGRSREAIIKYARQDIAFLTTFDLKAILIACGTVSSTALQLLQDENDCPIFGVVEPAARAAAEASRNGRIGLIGTEASIRSGAYEHVLATLRPDGTVYAQACPLFVPLVENGRFRPGDPVAELVVAEYLTPLKEAGIDTLVMGCTHYPLLRDVVSDFFGDGVTLIDAGGACAREVADYLAENDLLTGGTDSRRRYFVSDTADSFAKLASTFLGESISDRVEQIDITVY